MMTRCILWTLLLCSLSIDSSLGSVFTQIKTVQFKANQTAIRNKLGQRKTVQFKANQSSRALSDSQQISARSALAVARHGSSKNELKNELKGLNLKAQQLNTTSHAARRQQLECGVHLKMHPSEVSCPDSCPYLRSEPTRLCEFKCVVAKDCGDDNPLTSFANPDTLRCEACLVAACHLCTTDSKHTCKECHSGFELIDGTCLYAHRKAWWTLYAIIGFVVLIIVYYAVQLVMRKTVNAESLKHGMDHRYLSSMRNTATGSQWPLKTDMQRNPRPAGLATMLHFRFMGMSMLWGLSIMIILLAIGMYSQHRPKALRTSPENTFNACDEHVKEAKVDFEDMECLYFMITLMVYIASTAGSIAFAKHQRETWVHEMEGTDTMGDYALITKGFPILDGKKDVEKDFEEFLRKAPQLEDLNIVGVSVCWNYREKQKEIEDQVKYERSLVTKTAWGETIESGRRTPRGEESEDTKRSCCDSQLTCVDTLLGVGNFPCVSDKKEDLPDIVQVLDSLKTTEHVFIIFRTPKEAVLAQERTEEDPLNYEGSEITLNTHFFEPQTVNWDGWGCTEQEFHIRLVLGGMIIIAAIVFLDVFFYAPYVQYIMSYSDVAGMSQGGFVTGTLLGLLITICNQLIYQVITMVSDKCGWTNGDKEMRFYVIQYTLAVLFNTCVDLWTVIILARGFSVDEALTREAQDDSTMSAKAMAESPSIQKALYVQMVAYIFPSCLLLPFLLEPIVGTSAPYWLGKLLVRSRDDVSIQDAESCLQMMPYDLSRYGDVLVNIMLCCIMFAFTYANLWMIWLYFLISMTVIYIWDKVRVLRFSCVSYYANNMLEIAVQVLFTMPCGILAACVAFRIYGAKHKGFLEEISKNTDLFEKGGTELAVEAFALLTRYTIVPICVGTFFAHCILHTLLLKYLVHDQDKDADDDLTPGTPGLLQRSYSRDLEIARSAKVKEYSEVAAEFPASWFTVNPVHSLRSKYKYSTSDKYRATDNPPCSLYQTGKPYLIELNNKLGVYFKFKDRIENIPTYEERNKKLTWSEWWERFNKGYGHKVKDHATRHGSVLETPRLTPR